MTFTSLHTSQQNLLSAMVLTRQKDQLMLGTLLLVLLVLMLLGVAPQWPYSRQWGYYPSGGVLLLIVLLILFQQGFRL
ncbi:MAG: DUF3309 family protein [Planctomyces sp.]